MSIVELESVRPAREIGIPAIGEDHRVAIHLEPTVVTGFTSEVLFCTPDIVLRMLAYPGMVRCGVVDHEVQQ
jgi:hypothetical protein